MTLKRIGAAVGIVAVLVLPLAACGSSAPTVTTVTATPTTLSLTPCPPVSDPAWESCVDSHRAQQERDAADRQKQAAAAKPAPQGGGIPWWCWVLGTIIGIGGLLWWGTALDDGSTARAALRAARDDDDDDEGSSHSDIPTPRNAREKEVLDAWIDREDAREQAGQPSRRWPTPAELTEMTRLGVQDYDQLPGNSALSYPAITPVAAAEPIPYPEPSSAPVAPTSSGGSSLMDRLGK